MSYSNNRNIHRPLHLFLDNQIYFITSRTYKGIKYFNFESRRKIIKESIRLASLRFNIGIFAWAVLENHYHLLIRVKNNGNDKLSDSEICYREKSVTDFSRLERDQSVNPRPRQRNDKLSGNEICYREKPKTRCTFLAYAGFLYGVAQ